MFSIDLDCRQDNKDVLIADLWEAGSTGIVELKDTAETASLRAFFDDDELAPQLEHRFGGTHQPADTRDWVAFAREHLKPMSIGAKLFVIPEWCSDPTPTGRLRIEINAGLAFGTGAHETTRLCLEALERLVFRGCSFADIGTGSGILAEAACKLGAAPVQACDSDPDAVIVAAENFARANVLIFPFIGSADSIASASADVIAANISPAWIADLASEWYRILRPEGAGILSGFEAQDVEDICRALTTAGCVVQAVLAENSWRAIEIRKPI